MKEHPETMDSALFNAAVDGLESIILGHAGAGVDVCSDEYLQGIETAYTALNTHFS